MVVHFETATHLSQSSNIRTFFIYCYKQALAHHLYSYHVKHLSPFQMFRRNSENNEPVYLHF